MKPKKRLGQHFLLDREAIARMLDAIVLKGNKVLEIGAGTGVITAALAERGAKVVAVEIDAEALKKASVRVKKYKNVELKEGDVRDVDFTPFDVVIGAIPYYLSSELVFRTLKARKPALFVVQKEFAERLAAKHGSKAWGRLSLMAQSQADVQKLFDISRFSFYPPPEVDSSVVLLQPKTPLPLNEDIVRALFSHKNQNVRNAFVHSATALRLDKKTAKTAALPFAEKRVRDLDLKDWQTLSAWFELGLKA